MDLKTSAAFIFFTHLYSTIPNDMKRRRAFLAIAFSASITMAVVSGCGDTNTTTPTSTETGTKVLTMVTSPDYPPYEFYDTTSGKKEIVGFDIDIAKYIAKELNFELKIDETNFDGLIPAIQAKKADFVMAGMTPTPERTKSVDFSILYYDAKDTILALKGRNLTKAEQLSGLKVGVQLGSIQEGNLKEIAKTVKDIQIVSLNKIPEIIQEVKSKRIDAAIIEDTVATGFKDSNTDIEFNVLPSAGASGAAIAFPKGSANVEDFNKVLKKMKESGEIDKLATKWFGKDK
jgi:arginine/lysine/histidine transporter system substrate-binding protein